MESRILKALVTLGVPCVALGVFYLLLTSFGFQFHEIGQPWAAVVAIICLLIVGGIAMSTLHRFAPERSPHQNDRAHRSQERVQQRTEDWFHEALRHTENVLRHIDASRSTAIQKGGRMHPEQVYKAIVLALTPEYAPDKLQVVEHLPFDELKEQFAKVQEAFGAVRMTQTELADGAAPACEAHEPFYAVQWYSTQLEDFTSVARRILAGT
jgi:hypothetical protein